MNLKIYPSIGIARMGNGPANKEDVIFSPEVPWANLFETNQEYHTINGALKKQAQRFYIYECDSNDIPIRKLEIQNAQIEWTVEVANKKPFWYDFNNSLDLSIKTDNENLSDTFYNDKIAPGISTSRRNPNVLNEKLINSGDKNFRKELVNSPSAVTVSSENIKQKIGGQFPFPQDTEAKSKIATAMKTEAKDVSLGTAEYDEGTLIFYPADGISAALNPSDLNTDFADNSNWYDDICDGRVTAKVTVNGQTFELNNATSAAWIATAPPDYAPQIQPISTMYDLICGTANEGYSTDFSLIFPVLYRLYRMQWVNASDFLAPSFREIIDQLSAIEFKSLFNNSLEAQPIREKIFNLFRNPRYSYTNEPVIPSKSTTDITNLGSGTEDLKYPFYPGDGINYPGSPAQWFAIPPMLYEQLKSWRDGNFNSLNNNFTSMDEIGLYYQNIYLEAAKDPSKSALLMTRAVLETLYGGGFHPGVELTWPMRHKQMYAENKLTFTNIKEGASFFGLREIRIASATQEEQAAIFYNDFGFQMNTDNVKASLDPSNEESWLWKTTPGDLTKWMGIPWQSDAGSCQKVFLDSQYPIPAWWAANLPVDVLTEDSLVKIQQNNISNDTKQYLYANRLPWLMTTDTGYIGYHAEGGYLNGLINMVYKWKDIGVVAGRNANTSDIPEIVYVSTESKNVRDTTVIFLGKEITSTPVNLNPPSVFYTNTREMVWLPEGKSMYLSSTKDGTGNVSVDDALELSINGNIVLNQDFSNGCSGKITPLSPINITDLLKPFTNNFVTITINYIDKCGGYKSATNIYLTIK
ncbi:LodA/GoxA family CTQ-dependent oxidase [Tenacibaculum ovolyticum]|uniref:LodA/GoxA family CTQ-dependent oxidase n=1 Tax=Tenacibaculum ovolyticum TaxID=104270 RepID=UPI0007EE078A|nr:LodA/GoxA family CTQ-dependent oxidase [Tenacibaculum ovolyticum]